MKQAEKWQKDLAVYRDINTTFIVRWHFELVISLSGQTVRRT